MNVITCENMDNYLIVYENFSAHRLKTSAAFAA